MENPYGPYGANQPLSPMFPESQPQRLLTVPEEKGLKKREFFYLWLNLNMQSGSFLLWKVLPYLAVYALVAVFYATGDSEVLSDPSMQFWASLFANALAFVPFFFIRRIKLKTLFNNSPEKRKKFMKIGSILGLFVLVFGLNILAGMFSGLLADLIPGGENSVNSFHYALEMSGLDKFYYLASVVIIAPIGEELIFRGGILMPLRRYGDGFAILFSGFFFGLMHGNLQQIPGAMVMGMFWGYIACKSDSILPGIVLHFLNNLLVTLSEIATLKNAEHLAATGKDLPIAAGFNIGLNLFVLVALLATVVVIFIVLWKMITKNYRMFGGDYRVENLYRVWRPYMPNRFLACISSPVFLYFFYTCIVKVWETFQ